MISLRPNLVAWILFVCCLSGCSRNTVTSIATLPSVSSNSSDADSTSPESITVTLDPKPPTPDEKYQTALLASLRFLVEKHYPETLESLKAAQVAKDTDEVRLQLDKVKGLILEQAVFEQTVADIQTLIDLGQCEDAAQLTIKAMAQFDDDDEVMTLQGLKRQADAILTTQSSDIAKNVARYRAEAEAALKDNNFRAALFSLEMALAQKTDTTLQNQAETIRTRLNQYDAAILRARQFRLESQSFEHALTAYQEAKQVWDTEQVRSEIADIQLALEQKRDRLAVATFETGKDSELAAYAATFADELLPHFKTRYDLVDRTLIHRLLAELKTGSDEIVNSQEGRLDLSRLAQARYLVVGSISPLSGVTVHARLIDLKTGLVVQTSKIVAGTTEEALSKLPQLAAMLLFNDEEKLAYERQQNQAVMPSVVNTATLPGIPVFNPQAIPAAISCSTTQPPAIGTLQMEDYDRLPSMTSTTVNAIQMTPVEQERPLRLRILAVQLELGDNLYLRGKHREALERYHLARELDPANLDILARINNCQQYLPPPSVQRATPSVRRERIAFLNFFVIGDRRLVPPGLSTWTPENLIPYYEAQFDVVDRGEVYWMMGRLGLTLSDVVKESGIRRWLGRALNARYLALGSLQHTGNITLTLSILDNEQSWELSRAQLWANDVRELKLCLPELARLSLASSAERVRLEKEEAQHQAEYLRAQEALQRGQFSLAIEIGNSLRKAMPLNIRMSIFLAQAEEQARFSSWEQARLKELERQRRQWELVSRRQAELAVNADRMRQAAYLRANSIAAPDRERQREQARQQLLSQARAAVQNNKQTLALQLFTAALALRPKDEAVIRETAQVRLRFDETKHLAHQEQIARQEEAKRRQQDVAVAASRQLWINDRKKAAAAISLQNEQRQHDATEVNRLLEQAQRLKTQGRFEQAAAMLQVARRLKHSDEVERMQEEALLEQMRAQAKAEDAGKFAELERKLAMETARRKQAEQDAERNWSLYQSAMQQAREAQRKKDISLAMKKCQEALRLFHTEEAVGLWQTCLDYQQNEKVQQVVQLRQTQVAEKRKVELVKCLEASKAAEQMGKYDEALSHLRRGKELDPSHVELQLALTRLEQVRLKQLMDQKAQAAKDQSSLMKEYLAQAQSRTQAGQYDAALIVLDAARKLSPGDQQVATQQEAIKQLQQAQSQSLSLKLKKEEEARQQVAARIETEEKAKQQGRQAREQAEAALNSGDMKAAETALASAVRLAPRDPALLKLQQELTRAKSQAARVQAQADAKARIEALAQSKLSAAVKEQQGHINDLLKKAQAAIAKKDFGAAEKLIGDALAIDSTNLAAGRVQRELNTARQVEAQAKSAMNSADRKKQEEETAKKKAEFTQHMKEGKEALAAEDFEKAAKSFTAAKALNPEDPDAALFLGMANRNSDRAKAEAALAKKEEEEKKKQEMENAKVEADAKKKAEEEFRRKLAMDAEAKKRADALKLLNKEQFEKTMADGKQALASKRYEDAIKLLEKATQLMPDDKDAAAQLAQAKKEKSVTAEMALLVQLISKGKSLQTQKKWSEALTAYRQALVLSPTDQGAKDGVVRCEFQIQLAAGTAALNKKDKQAAIKSLEAAVKLDPADAEAQKLLKQARELK